MPSRPKASSRAPSPEGSADQANPHGQARARLLEAAAELFSKHGFESVTIRQIASRAGVRHGGVNYHFKSKQDLYLKVLSQFGPRGNHIAEGGNPELHGALQVTDPAEARATLKRLIENHLVAMTETSHPVGVGLIQQELGRPGGPDEQVFEYAVLLRHRAIEHLLQVIAPQLSDPETLRLFSMGITTRIAFFRLARPIAYRLIEADPEKDLDATRIQKLAHHILQTTLDGLPQ